MPRVCTVCTHPQREAIDKALVAGMPASAVAARYGSTRAPLGRQSLWRHRDDHLPTMLAKAQEAAEVAAADSLMAELRQYMGRVQLLYDACDRWLRDPENADQYDVGPRAEDVRVLYAESVNGKTVRKRARLSELLARVGEETRLTVEKGEYRHADPRELLLKTAAQLQSSLELLGKLLGELDDRPQINVLVSPEWHQVRDTLLLALQPYPEARTSVAERLRLLEAV